MKTLLSLGLALLPTLCFAKPQVPIDANVTVSNRARNKFTFTIEVKPLLKSRSVSVSLDLPKKARLLRGKNLASFAPKKGSSRKLSYQVDLSQSEVEKFRAIVAVTLENGAVIRKAVIISLNQLPSLKALAPPTIKQTPKLYKARHLSEILKEKEKKK